MGVDPEMRTHVFGGWTIRPMAGRLLGAVDIDELGMDPESQAVPEGPGESERQGHGLAFTRLSGLGFGSFDVPARQDDPDSFDRRIL
jgi:hypothetical protein